MNKTRKHFPGGIRNKIFLLILGTVVLLSAAFFGVTTYRNNMLSDLSAETAREQQAAIVENTQGVMTEVIRENLDRSTELEAMVTDDIFKVAKARVTLLADYATALFANAEEYEPKAWNRPDASRNGELVAQVILADGVNPEDPELLSAVGLIANMSEQMISSCVTFETDNAYIGLREGAHFSVSRESASWFNEDGSLKSYDPRSRYWYQQAAEAGELIFTDVEVDANTGELNLTCAMPVYGPDGTLRAVIGTDLYLSAMQEALKESEKDGGYHLVVNSNGHIIVSSLPGSEGLVQSSEQATDLRETENSELSAFIRDSLAGKTGMRRLQEGEDVLYMAGAPVETVGWAMISIYAEEKITGPADVLLKSYEEKQAKAVGTYNEKNRKSRITVTVMLLVLLVLQGVLAVWVGGRIVRPLNTMTKRISQIKGDNLEFKMEDSYRTGDEIETLAESFAEISRKTIQYVDQVRTVTAEKERIGAELNMAAEIQSSMLPHVFPAFPEREEFDLYAAMDPAKEVGGDFYDFFLIDEDHLCMVIADVSGKGVPAALVMMISKVILQNRAIMGQSAAEILAGTNEVICSNNQKDMFVTVWVGILEISTGKLTASNAGHEYPVLKRKGGDYELCRDRHGFVVGGMEGVRYNQYELQLEPGDRLFLYTDGVPEATDADQELFGTERMLKALNDAEDESPRDVLQSVRKAVDGFVRDAEQFDDLTMLCLEYKGPKGGKKDS